MLKIRVKIWVCLLWLLPALGYGGEIIRLNFPDPGAHHGFYRNLLESALIQAGHRVEINSPKIPHRRAIALLKNDEIDIYNLIQSADRDRLFVPIRVGLTGGLIGHRVLFIPKGDAHLYASIHSLEEFRALNKVVGMGANWFDSKVWVLNGLEVFKFTGDSNLLFGMVGSRRPGIDYYSTGFNEAAEELIQFADAGVELEENLMLIYDRDYRFYMSKESGRKYGAIIESALKKAKASGLVKRMVKDFWHKDMDKLDFYGRTRIHLKTPR